MRIDSELLLVRRRARRHEQLEVVERGRAEPGAARGRRLSDHEHGLAGTILARAAAGASGLVPELGYRARLADQHARSPRARPRRAKAPQPSPEGTALTPTWHSARSSRPSASADEAAQAAPRDVLEEDALDGILGAEAEDLLALRARSSFPASAATLGAARFETVRADRNP